MALNNENVSAVVEAFAAATIDPKLLMGALTQAANTVGAVSCAMEFADLQSGEMRMECPFPFEDDAVKLYEDRIFQISPRVRNAMMTRVGTLVDDRQLLPLDDPDTPEFLDWLGRTPTRYIHGAKILDDHGQVAFFGAHFTEKSGFPDKVPKTFNSLLVPHLINFVSVGRVLSANKLANELVTLNAFEAERPFALLDRTGRLIECSAGFETILRSRQVLGLRDRTLVAMHAQHRRKVEHFLQSALGVRRLIEPPMPVRLTTPDSARGIILRAIPLTPRDDVFDVFRPAALVTLTDLDRPARVRRQELVGLFGLTEREADVAALVSEGYTAERAAHQLAISEYTVRQHLKAVFGKIGVSRQAELVAIVSRLA